MADRFPELSTYPFAKIIMKNKLSDRMMKQSLNLVVAKYGDLSVSHRSIISGKNHDILPRARPIIVNYSLSL